MAIQNAIIKHRRGNIEDLLRSELLPGEYAISTDGTITICYAGGKTKDLASVEEVKRVSAEFGENLGKFATFGIEDNCFVVDVAEEMDRFIFSTNENGEMEVEY